jgi:PAS domain S-box-containing protein
VEEELNRKRKGLRIILDSVPAMVFYKDRSGKNILANRALANVLGLPTKEEIEGKTYVLKISAKAAEKISYAQFSDTNSFR